MSTEQPTDTLTTRAAESGVEPSSETTAEGELSLLERVKLLKSRQHLSHPDPRGFFKGPGIGNGPNGTRRSMGKR